MTTLDIETIEARRRLAAVEGDSGVAANILKGHAVRHYSDALAATLRELNWQPPVDPDLIEARKIVADAHSEPVYSTWAHQVIDGKRDDCIEMRCCLAAIKRGRELAAQEHVL
jgi:hypothetical protein